MTQRAPAAVGQKLEDIDTPALVLDLDGFEKNLATLNASVAGKVRVRPHAKTHKCPDVAKRQIALGAVGMCCQKVSEAEAMVEGGRERRAGQQRDRGRAQARPPGRPLAPREDRRVRR
jgi:D-serine deaminase-like pyridoxal phosphate-dependent protein